MDLVSKGVADRDEIARFLTSIIRGEIKSQRVERVYVPDPSGIKIRVPKVVEYINRETQISACEKLSKIMGYELKVRKEIDAQDIEYTDIKITYDEEPLEGVRDI